MTTTASGSPLLTQSISISSTEMSETNTAIQKIWETCVIDGFKTISTLQSEGMFCDLTLRSRDGVEFAVHKLVMCSVSGFFRDLFSTDFKDSRENICQLDVSTGAILEKVIAFVYQGYLAVVQAEECVEIANVAKYLQIKELTQASELQAEKLINESTCLKCWRLAKEYSMEKVEDICTFYIVSSAERLFEDESFVNDLSATEMRTILEDNCLNCDPETIFKTIEKWAKNTTNTTEEFVQQFSDVIDCISFSSLTKKFLLANLLENEELLADNKVLRKFADCIRCEWKENENLLENIKLTSVPEKHFLAIQHTHMLSIFPRERKVVKFSQNCYSFKDFGYTTFGNNFLLACGGVSDASQATSTCKYFSSATKKWMTVRPMLCARWGHQCQYVDEKIYACGGPSESVEILDKNTENWMPGPSMNCAKQFFGLTSINRALYAVDELCIERFDPRAPNKWSTICTNSSHVRRCRCVSIGYDIFCITGSKHICTFDTRVNQFKPSSVSTSILSAISFHVAEIDGDFGIWVPAEPVFYSVNINGAVTPMYVSVDGSKTLTGPSALVAMYC